MRRRSRRASLAKLFFFLQVRHCMAEWADRTGPSGLPQFRKSGRYSAYLTHFCVRSESETHQGRIIFSNLIVGRFPDDRIDGMVLMRKDGAFFHRTPQLDAFLQPLQYDTRGIRQACAGARDAHLQSINQPDLAAMRRKQNHHRHFWASIAVPVDHVDAVVLHVDEAGAFLDRESEGTLLEKK